MTDLHQNVAKLFYSVSKPRVLSFMDELQEMQWLSQDELVSLQHKHLHEVLEYANTYVPYYQELFKELGFHPSDFVADPACLPEIPFLTKEIIRQNYDRLITTEDQARQGLARIKTGGTTGEPLWLMQAPTYRDYNTAHVYHKMTWSGWQIGQPQAWLWGHAVVGQGSKPAALSRARNWLANRLESNAFHLTDASMEKFARQLEEYPAVVIWSYVSTMYQFAQFLEKRGHNIKALAVYTAAEPLYNHQRAFIEETLGCRVFDNYSCVEIGSIACECEEHNGLHITTRNCYVEVIRDGHPVTDGETGEFVLTSLTNFAFPLIRYQVEDWGSKSTRNCSCGRGLPMLNIVEGRIIDHFITKDGRLVWGAFVVPMVPVLGSIRQYQIVQKSIDLLVFRIVQDGPLNEERFQEIQHAVKTVLGDEVEARLELVESLPTSLTGKHRYVVSEVQ